MPEYEFLLKPFLLVPNRVEEDLLLKHRLQNVDLVLEVHLQLLQAKLFLFILESYNDCEVQNAFDPLSLSLAHVLSLFVYVSLPSGLKFTSFDILHHLSLVLFLLVLKLGGKSLEDQDVEDVADPSPDHLLVSLLQYLRIEPHAFNVPKDIPLLESELAVLESLLLQVVRDFPGLLSLVLVYLAHKLPLPVLVLLVKRSDIRVPLNEHLRALPLGLPGRVVGVLEHLHLGVVQVEGVLLYGNLCHFLLLHSLVLYVLHDPLELVEQHEVIHQTSFELIQPSLLHVQGTFP